ncbi:MAG: phosphoglycerate dehydrogenase [Nannocystaceae bacterium]
MTPPSAHALVLESIHPSSHEVLAAAGVTVHAHAKAMAEEALIEALRALPGRDKVVGIRSKTRITARVLEAVPELVAIGAFCIGTDQIDLKEARARGVAVFNAPFSSTRSVAELVLGEIIMLARQIFPRAFACHRGEWDKSATGSHEVRGKTLGIVGYGHIGSQLSILAEALGMQVIFHDIVTKLPLGNARPCASLDELLDASDFVSLHVPDTPQTRGMIDAAAIARMVRGACLINASRGQVVDVDALRGAVDEGRLAGAAIDVYPKEPQGAGERFTSVLQGCERIILTPHIGGSTEEAQASIGREVATALGRYLELGVTPGSVTLPELDAPPPQGCRLVNLHRNVPGVLSEIHRQIAASDINITGEHLGTIESIGLLLMDMEVGREDPRAQALCQAIAAMPTSLRTRLL